MAGIDTEMQDASGPASNRNRGRSRSVHSDALSESGAEGGRSGRTRTGRRYSHRRKGVFDAVAGRTRVREPRPPKWPGQPTRFRHAQLAPEEALFRSAGAPPRYEETDTYFAHAGLPAHALPASELVKAVHHYASHYYEVLAPEGRGRTDTVQRRDPNEEAAARSVGGAPVNRRLIDERSMDETALLAFGILLEEAGRAVLGRDGAMVLTEAAADGEADGEYEVRRVEESVQKRTRRKRATKRRQAEAS
ncbi:uncharacterized protein SPSK_00876 [Sporothrix schenckii 1099-18]|uniref:Uncharacterized protein n=2 Tax=Sporothrix schenckii TaxID=29908 RepID=U7PLZ9_SPOS1|nr:uncharacterized protein SPSK_00876 [Sporothrix schenckii 1099-18]ERS95931.1 hypothetical protein HMPREF1624_07465 [Sporothrix schenckii ATCC 58251]KJR81827.1 membrane protein [Sporothrix schenckii 1099-18]